MDKPIYNVVNFRNRLQCVFGGNKKIANKNNNFIKGLGEKNNEEVEVPHPSGITKFRFVEGENNEVFLTIPVGEPITYQLTASIEPASFDQSVTYELNYETAGVSVDNNGLVTITNEATIEEGDEELTFAIYAYPTNHSNFRAFVTFYLTKPEEEVVDVIES